MRGTARKSFLGLLLSVLMLLSARVTLCGPARGPQGSSSRFGIDYVFPLQDRFQNDIWARRYKETGAGWVNFAMVSWAAIEPFPPEHGVHRYQWTRLDRAVKSWQKQGFSIVISLRLGHAWFSGPRSRVPAPGGLMSRILFRNSDRLPLPCHRRHLSDWITALVERYDCDSVKDMPGLLWPVLHYQVGNEYANPAFWTGTIDDYGIYLEMVARAARAACADVKIISNGIRWNDLFSGDPGAKLFENRFRDFLGRLPSDEWRKAWLRARRMTEFTVAEAGVYDILDAGGNGPFADASAGYMKWVERVLRKTGHRVAVWDMEARCEPQLAPVPHGTFLASTAVPNGKSLLGSLKWRWSRDHEPVASWYRREMAIILVKVFVTRYAAGFEKVFMGMPDDWDGTWAAWSTANPYMGLCDGRASPWPAFRALKFLVHHLDGFICAGRVALPGKGRLYRFDFREKAPVYVAWLDDAKAGRGPQQSCCGRLVTLPVEKDTVFLSLSSVLESVPAPAKSTVTGKVFAGKTTQPVSVDNGNPIRIGLGHVPVFILYDKSARSARMVPADG